LLEDIDAISFMIENMLSAVCSSASVTNVIYLVFVPCFIIRYNHHLQFVCVITFTPWRKLCV